MFVYIYVCVYKRCLQIESTRNLYLPKKKKEKKGTGDE